MKYFANQFDVVAKRLRAQGSSRTSSIVESFAQTGEVSVGDAEYLSRTSSVIRLASSKHPSGRPGFHILFDPANDEANAASLFSLFLALQQHGENFRITKCGNCGAYLWSVKADLKAWCDQRCKVQHQRLQAKKLLAHAERKRGKERSK